MNGLVYHIGLKGEILDTFYSEDQARLALSRLLDLFPIEDIVIEVEKVPLSFLKLFSDVA